MGARCASGSTRRASPSRAARSSCSRRAAPSCSGATSPRCSGRRSPGSSARRRRSNGSTPRARCRRRGRAGSRASSRGAACSRARRRRGGEAVKVSGPFPPRVHQIGAAVVALLMLGSLARSFLRTPPRAPDEGASTPADDAAPSAAPTAGVRTWLTFEVQAEVRAGEAAPPLKLRLRTREGVAPTFDVTTRESPVKSRFSVPVALPVARPELPLRAEVLGDAWCIPPGAVEFEVRRLDVPYQLTLARAHPLDV